MELRTNVTVAQKHLLCGQGPGLHGGFICTMTSKAAERIFRTENLKAFDSEPFRKFTHIPVNDSLGSAGKSNLGKI